MHLTSADRIAKLSSCALSPVLQVGDACLDSLAAATYKANPDLYSYFFQNYEACGITWNAPLPAPAIAPEPVSMSPPPPSPVPIAPAPAQSAGRIALPAAAATVLVIVGALLV